MMDFINGLSNGMYFIGLPLVFMFTGIFLIAALETGIKYTCKRFQAARKRRQYYHGYSMQDFAWKTRGKKGRR